MTAKAYGVLPGSDTEPPSIPGTPELIDITGGTATFQWTHSTDNVGVAYYTVLRNGLFAGTAPHDEESEDPPQFQDNGLSPGVEYTWTVRANDAAGNQSLDSGALVETTPSNSGPIPVSPGPQALTVGQAYSLDLLTIWTDPDGDPITFTEVVPGLPAGIAYNPTTKTISGTPTTTQNTVWIYEASDGIEASPGSLAFEVLNADTTAPSVPASLSVAVLNATSLRITWGGSTDPLIANALTSGVLNYDVYCNLSLRFPAVTALSQDDEGLSTHQLYQYEYQVRARDAAGNVSALSAVKKASQPVTTEPTWEAGPAVVTFVQGQVGQSEDLGAFTDPPTNNPTAELVYSEISETVISGGTLTGVATASTGIMTESGASPIGETDFVINCDDVDPPTTETSIRFTEIPELAFVEGYGETEQLGVYQIDVNNRWTPGDFTRASGWQSASPMRCLIDGGTTGLTHASQGGTWFTYDNATCELVYNGASITGAHQTFTCYLTRDDISTESVRFRVRILRPTHVYGTNPNASDINTARGWGANVIDPADAMWFEQGLGPMRIGTAGQADSTPRVVFLPNQIFGGVAHGLSQNWQCTPDTQAYQQQSPYNRTSYLYILGDTNRPTLQREISGTGSGFGRFNMKAHNVVWYLKNLDISEISINGEASSDARQSWVFHKVRQVDSQSNASGDDSLGSSSTFEPFSFPSATRTDAVSGTAGTHFHTYTTFFEGRRNGGGGLVHQMYMEGNGTTATFVNTSQFYASHGGSSLNKTIQSGYHCRNSILSVTEDFDNLTSNNWSAAIFDAKATCDFVTYNNDIRIGITGLGGDDGTRQAWFIRARRTASGASIPPYPNVNWENPTLSMDGDWGAGYDPIYGFSQGTETFINDDYWLEVRGEGTLWTPTDPLKPIADAANPYTFKHFMTYDTVRIMRGAPVTVLRDDGTHPTEAITQGLTGVKMGTHPNWIERSVSFVANWTLVGGYTSSSNLYNVSEDISGQIENGTGNVMSSYVVTWHDGTQGYVRLNNIAGSGGQAVPEVHTWSQPLNSLMRDLDANELDGIPYSVLFAHTVTGTLAAEGAATPQQRGQVEGPASQRDVYVTITGTWVGTITLQRSPSGTTNFTDLQSWTSNVTDALVNVSGAPDCSWLRLVFKSGQNPSHYTSGSASVSFYVPFAHVTTAVLQPYWPPAIPEATRPVPEIVEGTGSSSGHRFSESETPAYIALPDWWKL